jgi:nucleotide-binding universal stress UspA family protein
MSEIRTIVVGVAGLLPDDPRPRHEGEDPVLEPAAELANELGAVLHVVHAYLLPESALAAWRGRRVSRTGYAARIAERLEAQVARYAAPDRIRCHAVEGSAGAVLSAFADRVRADLLVVGASRRGQMWRGILGTTATQVLRTARQPVLVVHEPFAAPVRRVLLAVDLSSAGRRLERRAEALVPEIFGDGQRFRAVHVVSCDPMLASPVPERELELAAERRLRTMLSDARLPLETAVRSGEPSVELIREAEEWHADLLVLGTHDPAATRSGTLGGTAASTLRHSACNVLVLPGGSARRRPPRAARPRAAAAAHG